MDPKSPISFWHMLKPAGKGPAVRGAEVAPNASVLTKAGAGWQFSHPPGCVTESESGNLQVFIATLAAESGMIKWLLPIKGINCWQYPYLLLTSLLAFDFFFSLSILPVQFSSPLQGDWHDAESSLWLPEAQVWWEVRNAVLPLLCSPRVTNVLAIFWM